MLIPLLWITVLVTLLGWSLPMLFLPYEVMVRYRLPISEPVLFLRLLGAASLGLAIMYAFGLVRAYRGQDVTDVIIIGLVTQGMGAASIWRYALANAFESWPTVTRRIIYTAGAVMTFLALGLLFVGAWHVL